jgi:hypothetical protein
MSAMMNFAFGMTNNIQLGMNVQIKDQPYIKVQNYFLKTLVSLISTSTVAVNFMVEEVCSKFLKTQELK